MTEPKQPPKKHLVSAREYVRRKAERTVSFLIGGLMTLIGAVGTVACADALVRSFLALPTETVEALILCVMAGMFGVCSLMVANVGKTLVKEANVTKGMELLTARKAEALPVEETLVRASAEPTQEQEKVLLRAAITSADTPQDQLLRPGHMPD